MDPIDKIKDAISDFTVVYQVAYKEGYDAGFKDGYDKAKKDAKEKMFENYNFKEKVK